MKKSIFTLFTAILMLAFIFNISAQVPQAFNYQAVARDNEGVLLKNQLIGIKIDIHQNFSTGTVVYSETHSPTTNNFGLFTISLGQGTPVTGTFNSIIWSTGNYWLQVQMDPAGGSTYVDMGTSQLLSVPFAIYAENTGNSLWTDNTTYINSAGNTNAKVYNNLENWVYKAALTSNTDGTDWGFSSVKSALYGTSNNKSFQTGVYGYQMGSAEDAAGVLGAYSTAVWGGLGYYKNSTSWGGYFNGKGYFSDRVGIGTNSLLGSSMLNVVSHNKYAGYFSTDSVSSLTHAIHAEYRNTGDNNGAAVYGKSYAADGYGYGGSFFSGYIGVKSSGLSSSGNPAYGFSGTASSSFGEAYGASVSAYSSTGNSYGVYGSATTTAGIAYGVYCNGDGTYTGNWGSPSDQKFKKDIETYSGALEKILNLRTVTYFMRTDEYPEMNFATNKQFGFIAQEMEKVFPTLVMPGVHPGAKAGDLEIDYISVNYIGLIPVLVKAIQEQQAEIEVLKLQVKSLQK